MSESTHNDLTVNPGGVVNQPELGDYEWFQPVLPTVKPAASKPIPIPKEPGYLKGMDDVLRARGVEIPEDTTPEPEQAASEPATVTSAPVPARMATANELFAWIKKALLAETPLSHDAAELVAFWVKPTWLQEALAIRPCLVITGPAYDATRVLHVLERFCCVAVLLAGFGRNHLKALRPSVTNLILEPDLNKRTANLLGSLTDAKVYVAGSYLARYSKSTAIYAGESPEPPAILNSIHVHISPTTDAAPPADAPRLPQGMVQGIPVHLKQYREKNLTQVQHSTWVPSGLSPEMATIATELGRCLVDAPDLRQKLVAVLKTQDRQRRTDMCNTAEAFVLESILHLHSQGKAEIFVGEIANEANSIKKARGERPTFSAEKVGHLLKKLGLHTRRVSAGILLEMDQATIAQVRKLAEAFGV